MKERKKGIWRRGRRGYRGEGGGDMEEKEKEI